MVAGAPTLAHDYAILDLTHGSPMPIDLLAKITQPTLVLAGAASPPFMIGAAHRMATILPAAELVELPDQDHVVPPEILAPHLKDFLLPQ